MVSATKRLILKSTQTFGVRVSIESILYQSIRVLRRLLYILNKAQARIHQHQLETSTHSKDQWVEAVEAYYNILPGVFSKLGFVPKISVLVPVYKVKSRYLEECLNSVAAQIYRNWELCIVDDGSHDKEIANIIERFQTAYPNQVIFKIETVNRGICGASQIAFEMATGEYVALLDHDDRLLPNALLEVARSLQSSQRPEVIYSDESRISEVGAIEGTFHKPDWSPLFGLAVHYPAHLSVYKKSLIQSIGGFRLGFEGSQDHDLMLRATELTQEPIVHIPMVLYQWRAHPLSTARNLQAKPYAAIAGEKAVREACERRGWPADVAYDQKRERYSVKFQLKKPNDKVSIIVPTRDNFDLIEACLRSIFAAKTEIPFEIILVDHESTDSKCIALFQDYQSKYPGIFSRIVYHGSFNFGAMNNQAVQVARGQYVLFLNNDTEVRASNWLEELVAIAQLPSSGAVGGKLLLANGNIQHAGIVGLGHGVAGNAGLNMAADAKDYFGYLQTTHEVLSITGACLLISKEKFLGVGGFDEVFVPNGYGDVDLCLRLREKGLNNVYVPAATLIHRESPTRKASLEIYEKWYMLKRWGRELVTDPYLNINLDRGLFYRTHFDSIFQQPDEQHLQNRMQKPR